MNKEIVDKDMMGKIIQNLFTKIPISMVYNGVQIPIQIISATHEGIVIKSTRRQDKQLRELTFTNNGSQYHFWFELADDGNFELEFLNPVRMEIQDSLHRAEERIHLDAGASKSHITNIIPEDIVYFRHSQILEAIESIWNHKSRLLKEKYIYHNLKIDGKEDLRFKIFKSKSPAIFLPSKDQSTPFNTTFFNPVHFKDLLNIAGESPLVGPEISIPIYLKNKILLGYLQVKHNEDLTLSDFNFMSSIATLIQGEINLLDLFIIHSEKCEVEDISIHGIGFHVTETEKLIRDLRPGRIILFQAFFERGLNAYFKAIIRNNVKLNNGKIRIGCEFFNQTPEEKIFIENFSKKAVSNQNP
ncbi:MAG: PilZ domain-containing protein [Leptospiraceae bacterium]|nr:PilZ domain-containing protein [Leptospiraceae bacterium]MCP5512731.1 PilZ domain-containing protein [Leptospiraceae bacterium]